MKDGANSGHCWQAEGACEAEGVEEGEDAEDASPLCRWKTCSSCSTFAARLKCESTTPLGSPVEPLEKNDGGCVVERRLSGEAERAFEHRGGKQLRG